MTTLAGLKWGGGGGGTFGFFFLKTFVVDLFIKHPTNGI